MQVADLRPRRQAAGFCIVLLLVIAVAMIAGALEIPMLILEAISSVAEGLRMPLGLRKQISSFVYEGGTPVQSWDYWEIRIGTAGREQRVLSVRQEDVARSLTAQIAAAVANPNTSFWMRVENLHIDTYHEGDNNMTVGDNSPIGTWRA